ncbi:alpha/beta fold hydrolase [Acinetobacter rudis]|uniref:Alpha/beta fold hydrolase n=1 Tax=Acinetobacter rudis TaxID=632955 RepID=A0AAW8JB00_9GAMM|nr:alpha/beta fold hydrolase [Acinetobacter rudis]MDQ8936270.1 alpha/beta fold hydrolase [Acinetobacter rudis]MDQ9018532.1 alpha/beta fold hydrolase [Acinetobacter rudis]
MQTNQHWIKTQDGQQLCAMTWGDPNKDALVLVHGYPDNQEVWQPIIAELIHDFYIITYDVRGAGQSSVPKRVRDYKLRCLSQDLMCVTDQLLPNKAFHLAAHDWGSIQSWESVTDPSFKSRLLSYTTLSGPCLDHAAFWMRDQYQQNKTQFFQQLTKSWYIAVFQFPLIAPTVWQFFKPENWGKILTRLEKTEGLPSNPNIAHDGRYGVGLYRANFLPRLLRPRQRYAQCPVQAIVLKRDNFVSPGLIDELPKWVSELERVELDANHWAILSRASEIATLIARFAKRYQDAT